MSHPGWWQRGWDIRTILDVVSIEEFDKLNSDADWDGCTLLDGWLTDGWGDTMYVATRTRFAIDYSFGNLS